ncbi:DNA polymerase [Bacillus phage vB_BcgM]|nr:DNA polymerase [Bacillus phage vB_BcgM]
MCKREMANNGTGGCITCPFAYTDDSEQAQNYGCLPTEYDIIKMKEDTGHNWACHYDDTVMCGGFITEVKRRRQDLDLTKGGLISYDTWYHKGQEEAIREAEEKLNETT